VVDDLICFEKYAVLINSLGIIRFLTMMDLPKDVNKYATKDVV